MTRVTLALRIAVLLIASLVLHGCAVSRFLETRPGVDLTPVQAGAHRAQIEALLGTPSREWTTSAKVHYRLYQYDAGVEPNRSDAAAIVVMDIASLGLAELFWYMGDYQGMSGRKLSRMIAVAYDADGKVVGVFDNVTEFSVLPEDGRAPAAQPRQE